MNNVTRILEAIDRGDSVAANQLLPVVYKELRRLAAQKLANEKAGQTLDATALVHEAYLRLVGAEDRSRWQNGRHFFSAAAEAMRRILVDNARRKKSVKHGAGRRRVRLEEGHRIVCSPDDLLAVDEALNRFETADPAKAKLVKLRFFAGMSTPEAATALGISVATAERWWTFARVWLFSELHDGTDKKSEKP